jgi:hypothetical protein
LYGVAANLAFVPVLVPLLAWAADDDAAGVIGVAIAYSLAQYVNVAHAAVRLRRDVGIRLAGLGGTAAQLAVAGGAMAAAMIVAVLVLDPEAASSRLVGLLETAAAGAVGAVVFGGVAAALGLLGLERGFMSLRRQAAVEAGVDVAAAPAAPVEDGAVPPPPIPPGGAGTRGGSAGAS